MKLRTGFVSNSSSSSFAILGESLGRDIKKVTLNDLNTYDSIVVDTNMTGEGGAVLIHIKNKKMLEFVQKNAGRCQIVEVFGSYGSGNIKTDRLPHGKTVEVMSWEEEQSSPWDVPSLEEYLKYEEGN